MRVGEINRCARNRGGALSRGGLFRLGLERRAPRPLPTQVSIPTPTSPIPTTTTTAPAPGGGRRRGRRPPPRAPQRSARSPTPSRTSRTRASTALRRLRWRRRGTRTARPATPSTTPSRRSAHSGPARWRDSAARQAGYPLRRPLRHLLPGRAERPLHLAAGLALRGKLGSPPSSRCLPSRVMRGRVCVGFVVGGLLLLAAGVPDVGSGPRASSTAGPTLRLQAR